MAFCIGDAADVTGPEQGRDTEQTGLLAVGLPRIFSTTTYHPLSSSLPFSAEDAPDGRLLRGTELEVLKLR